MSEISSFLNMEIDKVVEEKRSSVEKKNFNTLRTESSEISSVKYPCTMKDPFPSGYVNKYPEMQVPLAYAESQDELAISTYDISIRFWILHTTKLKNVDKGILEGNSSIEPFLRPWYMKFITQQSRCLTDDNFFKGCYFKMVYQEKFQKFQFNEFKTSSEFFNHILQECPFHMSTDWGLSHMIASYSQLSNRYISINKDRISPIVKSFITEMDMLKIMTYKKLM